MGAKGDRDATRMTGIARVATMAVNETLILTLSRRVENEVLVDIEIRHVEKP